MVRAVQRIHEEKQPKSDHRKEVAVNGPSRRHRDYEIGDCQCQRSDVEPDRIVDPQPAECSANCTRQQLRREIPYRVRQGGEDEAPDNVPGRDIQTRKTLLEERRHKLDDRQDKAEQHETGDAQRELRPLERLPKPRANQNPSRQDDTEIPDPEQPPSKPAAANGPLRQPRHRVVQKGEESVTKETKQDALRVVVA